MWWFLERKRVTSRYIDVIKDVYDEAVSSMRIIGEEIEPLVITIRLSQGSPFSHYLFA